MTELTNVPPVCEFEQVQGFGIKKRGRHINRRENNQYFSLRIYKKAVNKKINSEK